MEAIQCSRCKKSTESRKVEQITQKIYLCLSCYDELLNEDIRMIRKPGSDPITEKNIVLMALTFEEYFD